jgi:adenylosuccinate synthase
MPVTVVIDAGFGDSGKGKIAAYLALARGFRHVVNGGTGPSAGHVLEFSAGRAVTVGQVPVGFAAPLAQLYIGPGTLIDERLLRSELATLAALDAGTSAPAPPAHGSGPGATARGGAIAARLTVDGRCGLISPRAVESEKRHGLHDLGILWEAGTTAGRVDYLWRRARRFTDITDPPCRAADVVTLLNTAAAGEDVLVLGAHGPAYSLFTSPFYPLTTCDECSAAGTLSRTGIAWCHLTSVIGVVNMLPTVTLPVPLAHEMSLAEIRDRGLESYGAVSGVRRRVASQPDLGALRRFVRDQQPTSLALGRADLYDPECRSARTAGRLSARVRAWIDRIEDDTAVPVAMVSTGRSVYDVVDLTTAAARRPTSHDTYMPGSSR